MDRLASVLTFIIAMQGVAASAQPAGAPPRITLSYADLADLALTVPIAAHVRIKKAVALKGEQAAGVAPGRTRFYVEAEVLSSIRGPVDLPVQVRYLAELPNGSDSTAKFKRKAEYLLLAMPGGRGDAGELKLRSADAHIPWSAEIGDRIRALLREAAASDAAPRITGIGSAFHVPGSLPGESETQLFLLAEGGRPISINVLRRPGMAPTWAVALGEIVDEAAATPKPDSLLWYRLACTLPRALPPRSTAGADPPAAAAIRADYAMVLEGLGSCRRNRTTR